MYSNSFFLKNMINRIFSCTSSDKKVRKHRHTTKNYMYSNLFFSLKYDQHNLLFRSGGEVEKGRKQAARCAEEIGCI
jgi:hypothetical protein